MDRVVFEERKIWIPLVARRNNLATHMGELLVDGRESLRNPPLAIIPLCCEDRGGKGMWVFFIEP